MNSKKPQRNRKFSSKFKKSVCEINKSLMDLSGMGQGKKFIDWEDTSLGDLFHFNGILNGNISYILPCDNSLMYKKCPEHSHCVALMWDTATRYTYGQWTLTLFNSLFHFKNPEEWKSFSTLIAAGESDDDPDRINVKQISEQFPYYASQRGLLQIAQDVDKMCRIRFGYESDVINYLRGIRQR